MKELKLYCFWTCSERWAIPEPKIFLTAEWKYLVMLNYEIEQQILRPRVPEGTELDTWNGKTFISVVGFLFLNTRVLGISIPHHRNFEEVNLRFYVRRKSDHEWRRGVAFIRELVPRYAIATIARIVYNEKYSAVAMNHSIDLQKDGSVRYGWKFQNEWNFIRAKTTGEAQPLVADSEAQFISEHYWGYAAQKDGGCMEYKVEHPSWNVWNVIESSLRCNTAPLYGEEFVETLRGQPTSAFVADGSSVIVRKGVRIR